MQIRKSVASLGCGLSCAAGAYSMAFIAGMTGQKWLLAPALGMAGSGLFMAKEAVVALLPEKKEDRK